jgi:hypothetical protein
MNVVEAEVVVMHVNLLIPSDRHRHYPGIAWVRDSFGVVERDCGWRSSIQNNET